MLLQRHSTHTFVMNKFLRVYRKKKDPGNNLHPLQTLQPRNVSHFCKEVRDELINYFMSPDGVVERQYLDRLEHPSTQRRQTLNPTCRKLARACPRAMERSSSRDRHSLQVKVSGVAQLQGLCRDTALTSVFAQTLGV
ncbi:hypothetical protein PR048_015766 [Dryococelus australis]|uniref:Uncharacterized protein n=1 Tax=Dryococelus australis TaxID=614101 RepID=A0ABQ9HID9_9NEOP|nr:hypothetical protein PR048_015766 [Dryococelus australis]